MFRILIVDDTKSVHAFVKSLLSKAPEIVTTSVFNGAEAIELINHDEQFDILLLDWEMPILNGPGTLRQLKKLGITTPIIMMTTKNAPEDIKMILELGVAEYLMKPFTRDILFERIAVASGARFTYAA